MFVSSSQKPQKVSVVFFLLSTGLLSLGLLFSACSHQTEKLTYHKDIAPIIQKNCQPCHLKGEAAPFELVGYGDIKRREKLIKYVIRERIMPPWPADPSYRHFANEMYLSDEEIASILKWLEEGAEEGTAVASKATAVEPETDTKPDLVIKVPRVKIPGNNQDLFLVMKIPFELPHDTFIRAIEFVPGNTRLVHHVNTHLIRFDPEKKKTFDGKLYVNQDQANSQTIHKELGLLQDDGTYPSMTPSVSNYLPGARFSFYPKEIGGHLMPKKGAFYLNDLHYGPTPVESTDSSEYRIYFDDHPPKRLVSEFQIGTLGLVPVVPELVVPANEKKQFTIQFSVPQDISLISIIPHMHLIGKSYLAYAVKPSGDTIPLIRINNWDFRWQYFYTFNKLLRIPRGTVIHVEGTYDNTADNPNNPFSPPREIRDRNGSMKTTDEMFQLIVTYVPYEPGDEEIGY